ncbi:phosphoribosyltransferase [Nodosilinea sp. AN01ver1]|uniref:phosphoribosyltransferase n=1 Tax=Nodosilinea sp. AN01ver1 TaxID=3423362 RepID=UPI003D312B65
MLDAVAHDMRFKDRADAGRQLAERLQRYAHRADVLVLGLPRGGVPVAYEVAQALNAPLDICLVRKLGVPDHEELALGAIASGGVRVLNADVVSGMNISASTIDAIAAKELQELQRRDRAYRGDRPPLDVRDRTVILVDDGIATGATMRAAVSVIKPQQPVRLIVAAPVVAPPIYQELSLAVDEVVSVAMPEALRAIGFWYEDFAQTSDAEVHQRLTEQS